MTSKEKARKKREDERAARKQAQEQRKRLVTRTGAGAAVAVLVVVGVVAVLGQQATAPSASEKGQSSTTQPVAGAEVPSARNAAANLVNPFEETDQFLAAGQSIYKKDCVKCHGAQGEKPESHSFRGMSGHHTDGDYVWVVTYGMPPAGGAR